MSKVRFTPCNQRTHSFCWISIYVSAGPKSRQLLNAERDHKELFYTGYHCRKNGKWDIIKTYASQQQKIRSESVISYTPDFVIATNHISTDYSNLIHLQKFSISWVLMVSFSCLSLFPSVKPNTQLIFADCCTLSNTIILNKELILIWQPDSNQCELKENFWKKKIFFGRKIII